MFMFALDLSIQTGQSQFFSASQDRQMENDLSPHQKLNHFDALPELQRLLRVLVSWENSWHIVFCSSNWNTSIVGNFPGASQV